MVERGEAGRVVQNRELGMGERVRGGKDIKKNEEGHKTTKVRREAGVGGKIGREKSVYSGKGKRDEERAQM